MASWRESVLAAEAKKAGNASEITRLTPIMDIIIIIIIRVIIINHSNIIYRRQMTVIDLAETLSLNAQISACLQSVRGKDGRVISV